MKKSFLLLSLSSLIFLASCNNNPVVIKKYTIKFIDGNGDILQTSEVNEGEMPKYEGKTPFKEAPNEHEYIYIGWDKPIEAASKDITYSATFDYVFLFGTYPQTLVTNEDLINKLKEIHTIDSYGYFTYDDKTYYEYVSEQGYVADDGTRVEINDKTYKYYEVKPIQWTILNENEEKFYTTYKLLDTCDFNKESESQFSPFPNNYNESELRKYLNSTESYEENGFKWRAFREDDAKRINAPKISNNKESTCDEVEGEHPYVCDDIEAGADYVFALSRQELRNSKYGFIEKDNIDSKRTAKSTDYARARDATLYTNNTSTYWTRSPSIIELGSYKYNVYDVLCDGAIAYNTTDIDGRCIRPAIKLS